MTGDLLAEQRGFELPILSSFEQQHCSETTGIRVRSERYWGDLERLSALRGLALPGGLPVRG